MGLDEVVNTCAFLRETAKCTLAKTLFDSPPESTQLYSVAFHEGYKCSECLYWRYGRSIQQVDICRGCLRKIADSDKPHCQKTEAIAVFDFKLRRRLKQYASLRKERERVRRGEELAYDCIYDFDEQFSGEQKQAARLKQHLLSLRFEVLTVRMDRIMRTIGNRTLTDQEVLILLG